MKIAICASMTFSKEMLNIGKLLESRGHKIHLPKFTEHYATLDSRDKMHAESIENKITHDLIRFYYKIISDNDAVLAINLTKKGIENYIGGNTFLELAFAYVQNKKLYLLNPIPNIDFADEIIAMKPIVLNGNLELII